MATITSLSNLLRSELGDVGRSFVTTLLGDGATTRFQLDYYPVDGSGIVVNDGTSDISADVTIEEHTGVITFDTAPDADVVVTVAGTYFRYFTTAEINNYVNIAFGEHAGKNTTPYGSRLNLSNLPTVEEYPVVVLACSLALYALANDAAYDIDISAPDGVNIPRSERYRQLTEMSQYRKSQYQELCSLLGIGLYRIEVATLRRISPRTNRYVPVYLPQELDDSTLPRRLHVPLPTYMDGTKSIVESYDIELYQADSFSTELVFPFSLVGYTLTAQIRAYAGAALVLDTFDITVTDAANGKATMSLPSDATFKLPSRAIWDLQITSDTDPEYQHTYLKGAVITEREVTETNRDPYASGWMG